MRGHPEVADQALQGNRRAFHEAPCTALARPTTSLRLSEGVVHATHRRSASRPLVAALSIDSLDSLDCTTLAGSQYRRTAA